MLLCVCLFIRDPNLWTVKCKVCIFLRLSPQTVLWTPAEMSPGPFWICPHTTPLHFSYCMCFLSGDRKMLIYSDLFYVCIFVLWLCHKLCFIICICTVFSSDVFGLYSSAVGRKCPARRISKVLTPFILHVPFVQIGEERATAIALMRKFIAYQFTDTVRNCTLFYHIMVLFFLVLFELFWTVVTI